MVTAQDLGLTGDRLAPDYATSRRIYLARTISVGGQWVMRLSPWTVLGRRPTSLADERALWDLPAGTDVHAMTDLVTAAGRHPVGDDR